jgi:hypothetical protein
MTVVSTETSTNKQQLDVSLRKIYCKLATARPLRNVIICANNRFYEFWYYSAVLLLLQAKTQIVQPERGS